MSSSRLDIVEQCMGSSHDGRMLHHDNTLGHAPGDQDSTRSTLQSFLEFLEQHHHNSPYKEIIRICVERMLQPIFGGEPQTIAPIVLNELHAAHPPSTTLPTLSQQLGFQQLQGQFLDQGYDALSKKSVGAPSALPKGVDPLFSPLSLGSLHLFLAVSPPAQPATTSVHIRSSHSYQSMTYVLRDGPFLALQLVATNSCVSLLCWEGRRKWNVYGMKKSHVCRGPQSKRRSS
ncbi:hypothetical protein M405DRAFT_824324 [Rhizopogon salebrosus TDB-379]|nr:hypothetical protein M405DRAFT_824324 [Rhizopogon salebrosus TDB-379]